MPTYVHNSLMISFAYLRTQCPLPIAMQVSLAIPNPIHSTMHAVHAAWYSPL